MSHLMNDPIINNGPEPLAPKPSHSMSAATVNILRVIFLLALTSLAFFIGTEYGNDFLVKVGIKDKEETVQESNSNVIDINTDDEDTTATDETKCETKTYTNTNYPDFSFDYDCNWTLSENKQNVAGDAPFTNMSFPKDEITLTNGLNILTLNIHGPLWEGSTIFGTETFDILANGNGRILTSTGATANTYTYISQIKAKGTSEFNTAVEQAQILGGTYIDDNVTYCNTSGVAYITKSAIVSTSEAGIEKGTNYTMTVDPTLIVQKDSNETTVILMADDIIQSMKY